MEQVDAAKVLPALYLPTPRVALGIALRGVATSAIDISDGLLGDLGHILERSRVGATPIGARLEFASLPTLPVVRAYLHEEVARDCVLAGGDDYELCFTAPADRRDAVAAAAQSAGVAVTRVGRITAEPGLALVDADGKPLPFEKTGYDHFDE
jgi:thiamine-monophosphate kinase